MMAFLKVRGAIVTVVSDVVVIGGISILGEYIRMMGQLMGMKMMR